MIRWGGKGRGAPPQLRGPMQDAPCKMPMQDAPFVRLVATQVPSLLPCTPLLFPPRRGVSSLVRLLRGRWGGTALLLVGIFPRGVAASNPLREKVRRVNLGLSSLVARESSERLLFLDAAALMPLQPDGTLDRAWTFDYVHLTNEMYARYGDALLAVLRPFV